MDKNLHTLFQPAQEATQHIFQQTLIRPKTAIVLGSGINVLENLDRQISIPYHTIPGFPETTVKGHQGVVTMGYLKKKPTAIFRGRFHRYEGHPWSNVIFPITLMKTMGIEYVILTNSAGGLNRFLNPGDLMLIRDHIYWQYPSQEERQFIYRQVGNRHQPTYDHELIQTAIDAALRTDTPLKEGTYLCLSGPTYETQKEIHLFSGIKADAVGMSTIPEAIWASCLQLKFLGISCITNVLNGPQALASMSHEEVVHVAQASSQKLDRLLQYLLLHLSTQPR